MTVQAWLLAFAALATVAVPIALLHKPLGDYMARVYISERDTRVERLLYRAAGVDPTRRQTWRGYLGALLAFSAVSMIGLYALTRLQAHLPYSLGNAAMSPDLAFNTAVSFVANTNWQSYSPEQTVGYTVQAVGLAVQMFLSSAVGMAVAVALVRGIGGVRASTTLGSFWVDLTRSTLRILLPLSVLVAVVLLAGGVIQNLHDFRDVTTLGGGHQAIPGGPVASQEAIKMLGTNGGGFFNANSAHPYENPSAWVNAFQVFLLLVIPFALPRTLGVMVGDRRLGYVVLATMVVFFVLVFVALTAAELHGHGTAPQLAGAATEGKEQRFGIPGSTLFSTATTGTSGGAADSMLGSYTAFGGMILMLNMLLGEVSPGGVGAGMYAILVQVVITVFLTGLLLGRAPMLLGKRVGVREMKLAGLFILVMPILATAGLAISLGIPGLRHEIVSGSLGNEGAHGMSEILYAFISAAINNGSAFAGLSANTPYLNVSLGVIILLGRILPITLVLALAGGFAAQDRAPTTAVELPIYTPQFVVLLMAMIVLIALPMFFPYLMVGPLAEGLR